MKEQADNLNDFGLDINRYAPEERAAMVDNSIRAAFRALIDDKNSPRVFANVKALYKALLAKGLICGKNTFYLRISPNFKCNRGAGISKDLSSSAIAPDQLRPFESGIANWTGCLNYEFYELASAFLPPGFLMMEERAKRIKLAKEAGSLPEVRKNRSRVAKDLGSLPEIRERRSKVMKELWRSPESREKMMSPEVRKKMADSMRRPEARERQRKMAIEQRRRETEALNKKIEAAITELPPPDAVEKMSITQMAKTLVKLNPKLNEGTVRGKFYKTGARFNQALYNLIRPYLLCEAVDIAPAKPVNILKIAAASCYFSIFNIGR
ncbi:MAG: hypothetical protein LBL21_00930 [Rickettsiales bacterium]|jgi:hypothetical protein|nr:hypothetical protein [Rickettsiales bacterium]